MADRPAVVGRPWWAWLRTARVAAALVVVGLLVAACSGGSPRAGGSRSSASYVAYSACMRARNIPDFPDPDPAHPEAVVGKESAQQLGVSTSTYESARQACVPLLPQAGGDTAEQRQELQCAESGTCSQAVVQKWMSGLRTLAQCLRTHGEPNWPDPVISFQGRNEGLPHFAYDRAGIDHHSPQVLAMVDECMRLSGFAGLPLP